jgi:NADH-quinone oxidoreductase subunit J
MTAGSLFFAVCALLVLAGGLSVLFARSPIRAAMGLLGTILGIAGLFLKLGAELLAAMEILIYAGAVVVLFVFVIMLIGPAPSGDASPSRSRMARWCAGALALPGALLGVVFVSAQAGGPTPLGPAPIGYGSVEALGSSLFTRGLVPFELTTALLVVAVVGAMAIAKGRLPSKHRERPGHATRRLFGGPIQVPAAEARNTEDEP